MASTTTLTLKHPVQLPDTLLTTLTVRRPTVGDILDFPIDVNAPDMKVIAAMNARLCGLNVEDLRRLDISDYAALNEIVARFQTAD